ncbi:transposase [Caulobacter sp. KR2-114]|uniref:transposase n=1 Tax=Caulobacter sp. KR2-114 TaxID=3400912 RepID=UPI003C0CA7C9
MGEGRSPQSRHAPSSRSRDPFRRSRTLGADFGLTPSRRGRHQRAISKRGDRDVRTLLYEAAMSMVIRTRTHSALKVWGLKLAKARELKCGCVAVARRLASVLHHIWVDASTFRFSQEAA